MSSARLSRTAPLLLLGLAGIGLFTAIFARLMTSGIRRDEQMYVPPIELLNDSRLYTDFFYNHVPGSAWLFHLAAQLLQSNHLLLTGRLVVFGGWLLLAASLFCINGLLTRSLAMTVFAVLVMITNDTLLTVTGMAATNNLLPLSFAYLGLGLVLHCVSGERVSPVTIGISGLFLAIAATIKASAIAFIAPAVIAALLLPRQASFGTRLGRVVLPLAIGGLIGAIPVLIYFASDPQTFLAHVVRFHTGPHVAYWQVYNGEESDVAMSLPAKAQLAFLMWTDGANSILLLVLLLLAILVAQRSASDGGGLRQLISAPVLLALGVFVLAFAMSFVPTPGFPQYYAPPLVGASLLLTALYGRLSNERRQQIRPVLIAASVMLVVLNAPRLTQSLPSLFKPDRWTVMRAHKAGTEIAKQLAAHNVEGKVATIAPIYPLEGKLPVYPELATGPFAYRIAEFAKLDLLRHYRTTSPAAIEAMLQADPPAALLLGFDARLEAPMLQFAEQNGYIRYDDLGLVDRYGKGILYIRPAAPAQ